MAFTLTREFMDQLSAAAAKGDFGPYIASVDPDVEWRIGGSEDKGSGREGVYNLAGVKEGFLARQADVFPNGIKVETLSTVIVGNTAIVETKVSGESAKAGPYVNYLCIVTEYSAETGKAVRIREYLDTNKGFAMLTAHGI